MKLLVVLALALFGVSSGDGLPSIPVDNSHYVEGQNQYIWMSNDQGEPQLVDLQEPVNENILLSRNGANNEYYLYTRSNPNHPQRIIHNNANSISSSNYNRNQPLNVVVHGWTGNLNSPMNPQITSALLAITNCNVIVVDWRGLASQNYVNAVSGVPSVGQFLGNFLQWLINTGGGNWNNVHLIGFSLGAHVVGVAGRTVGNRPARITGLDPAGPGWHTNSNTLRASDGQYVETIHTDGGLQGIMSAIGNGNFYPNGGRSQPGCSNSQCSHSRVYSLFAATVRYNRLVGRLCSNLQEAQNNACSGSSLNMGNSVMSKRGNGIYGLRTGASYPF